MNVIKFCEIYADMGGEHIECTKEQLITEDESNYFIKTFTNNYEDYFKVYTLNTLGLHYVEKLGWCSSLGCRRKYVSIYPYKTLSSFSLMWFMGGSFENKHYKMKG